MTEEERKILVDQQLSKAHRFLAQADEVYDLGYWDMAANRYYYACFHAVQGLFIHKGISAHKHAGMVSQFSLHFVKLELVGKTYGSFLARMMQLRQKADYNCAYDITEKDVHEIVNLSRDFICKVESLITHN